MKLINYEKIKNSVAFKELSKLGKVGIYGSFANGTDDKDSDIDMIVYSDVDELKIRDVVNKLSKKLKREINLLILNEKKLEQLRKKDYEFYIRLKLESVFFNGEIF